MDLISCDTFVCLPPGTANNFIIFGKNSDRPEGEVQEIIYQPRKVYPKDSKLRATYLEIDQVGETYAVILSKPSWMWGAEMGSNEFGVCIGNEAVWTKLMNPNEDLMERLLGMDLVRLGLERSKSSLEAVQVITSLLQKYRQGGPCSETMKNWSYHNSFLIADRKEAWVLETAGSLWAAEQVESGWRNISNSLSIGTKIDLKSDDLEAEAFKLGLWDGKETFHFAKVFSEDYTEEENSDNQCGRFAEGGRLLKKYSKDCNFDLKSMFRILRDTPSGICMGYDSDFPSTSSQVSVLTPEGALDSHWFTGTPDPQYSIFKPFVFLNTEGNYGNEPLTEITMSPVTDKAFAIYKRQVDRRHELYKEHERCFRKFLRMPELKQKLGEVEDSFVKGVMELLDKQKNGAQDGVECTKRLSRIFNDAVEKEMTFYRENILSRNLDS